VINPEYTVISVGEDNQYGHPDKEAVALYEKHTREEVFQTKDDGSLMFESDGKTIIKVITDAGQDPEGKKEAARALAAAVGSGTPIFVSRTGSLSTNAIGTVAPSRPTVFHGGREAPVADDSEGV
jgi:hypothetical protein